MSQTSPVPAGRPGPWVDQFLPQDAPGYPKAPSLLTFQSIRGILWRQRFIVLGVVALALLAAVVMFLLTAPSYTASATVRYDPPGAQIIEGQDLEPYIATNEVARHMETLAAVIESRSMALKVVDALDLANDRDLLGEMLTAGKPAGQTDEAWLESRRNAAAGIIRGSVSAVTPYDSRIMTINVTMGNPRLAARVANGYSENFVQQDVQRGIEANIYAQRYLEEQIDAIRLRLGEKEVEAIEYARRNGIIAAPLTQGGGDSASPSSSGTAQTMTAANLAGVNQIYTQARADRIEAEQRWRAVANVPAAQIPEAQNNPRIQNLRNELAGLRSQLSNLRERYREDYPEIRELVSRVQSIESEVSAAENEVKNSIRNAYQVAQLQENALGAEVSRVSGAALDEQDRRVQYSLIDREVTALRDQLATLLSRYNQLTSAANLRTTSVTPLDAATVPGGPTSPNLQINLIAALAIGLALAAALAILREVLDQRLRSMEDVESMLGVRALGQTPYIKSDLADALEQPYSVISEAYASIRSSLDFAGGGEAKVIQVTSSDMAEGKTTTAVCLALRYAAIGRRVILIDMDLRRPAVVSTAGLSKPGPVGLLEVLAAPHRLPEALMTLGDNLHVLAACGHSDNPVMVLSSGLVPELLQQLRGKYDMIIIDSSPVLGLADAPILSRYVDAVVMVVEANRAHISQARSSLRRLQEAGANIAGVVVTKYRALTAGQSYDYEYRYYNYESEK